MTFTPQFPPVSPDNYNLTQVTVTPSMSSFFSRIFGLTSLNVQATATAAYRPRDVAIVLDFSGSMNNETDLWNCESYLGSMLNTPNNTDPVFPQWGVYNPSYSSGCHDPMHQHRFAGRQLQHHHSHRRHPGPGERFLFQQPRRLGGVGISRRSSVTSTSPVGDNYLTTSKNTSSTPGREDCRNHRQHEPEQHQQQEFRQQGIQELHRARPSMATRKGRTTGARRSSSGPPIQTNDWRKNFFFMPDGVTPVNDNTALWDSGGNWLQPPGNYVINYKAILNWIVNSGANPFPSQLRSGNILYYSSIPTDVPAASYDYTDANSTISNQDQRFWKEYIDFVLGVWRDPNGNVQTPGSSTCSYGPDFACGDGSGVSISGPDSATKYNGIAFVAPTDNPLRPRHRFWFGPMTMIQYMLDTSISPGTFHDVSMVPAKLGIAGAITDIQTIIPTTWCR